MKTRVLILVGSMFFTLQFSTVYLFNQMLSLSENHKLPVEDLTKNHVVDKAELKLVF